MRDVIPGEGQLTQQHTAEKHTQLEVKAAGQQPRINKRGLLAAAAAAAAAETHLGYFSLQHSSRWPEGPELRRELCQGNFMLQSHRSNMSVIHQ
jgi:hypothetical protein